MNSFSGLFKKENASELILGVLFIVYLIMGKNPPRQVASAVTSLIGMVVIFFTITYMFMHTNPILATLGLFVAFDLIRRSGYVSNNNNNNMQKYMPSEEKKSSQFTAFHQFPYTLEQEVVKKRAPMVQSGTTLTKPSYKPILNDLYDASPLNSTN